MGRLLAEWGRRAVLNRGSKKAGRVPAWALAFLYLALAVAALALFHSYTVTDEQQIFLTPIFDDPKGWDIYRLDETGGRVALTPREAAETAGTVYLSRVLDPAFEESGYTTLELEGPVSVFLDGKLLYTTVPGSGEDAECVELPAGYEVPAAGEVPRLTLPPGYGGKTLTLVFARDGTDRGTPMVLLSSRAAETALTAIRANRLGMPAAAYMTAALLLLGLFLYGGLQGRWGWPMLLLTLAAVLQALYQLWEYGIQLDYHSALDIPVAALIPPLFAALPLCYLLCRMERGHRRIRAALVLIPAAAALVPPLFYLFDLSTPEGLYTYCTEALYLSIAAALVYAVQEARSGNRGFQAFLSGLGALIAALAAACLFSSGLAVQVRSVLALALGGVPNLLLYWCGAALFVLCTGMSVGDAIRHMAESRVKADILSAQVSALQGRLEATRAADEAIRIERHDLRHKLQAVAEMVKKGESAEALDYIGASRARLDELKPVRWCQNPVLDAVLASYFNQAKRLDIQVEATLAIPDELPVDAAELSTVFANALENAIHACAELRPGERKIVCKCISRPGLMFEVANTCAGEVRLDRNGLPLAGRRGHGIGTRSIAAFCEKHGAVCSYEVKNGWFKIRVVL